MTEKSSLKQTKGRLDVLIDSDILNQFRNYVFQKYGTLHYLGFELENIIRQYLNSVCSSTQTHENQHMKIDSDSSSKTTKKHIELLKWLGKNYNHQLMLSDIEGYIANNFGIDERTVRKYQKFLFENGFIKIYNAICEVNPRKIYEFLKQHVREEEFRTYAVAEALKVQPTDEIKESRSIKAYAAERYLAEDDIEEIRDKLEQFTNVVLSKKQTRNIIRKGLREDLPI